MKGRHSIQAIGPVTQPANIDLDMSQFTNAILHLSGNGSRVEVQFSPDNGTTWYVATRQNLTRGRYTLTTNTISIILYGVGAKMRLKVDTADLDDAWVEGIREVG